MIEFILKEMASHYWIGMIAYILAFFIFNLCPVTVTPVDVKNPDTHNSTSTKHRPAYYASVGLKTLIPITPQAPSIDQHTTPASVSCGY